MGENRGLLLKSSMSFGFVMGIYWVIKYFFFAGGLSSPFMASVYWGLTLAVPVIAYRFTDRYRIIAGGSTRLSGAWLFGVLMYFFAALVVSLPHYIFYRYFAPPDMLSSALNQVIELYAREEVFDEKTLETLRGIYISPILMAIQGIFNNVFFGMLFSLPVAALVARKKEPSSPTPTN